MSSLAMIFVGGSTGIKPNLSYVATDYANGGGSSTAAVTFNPDGTVFITNDCDGDKWHFLAPVPNIGNRYWIQISSGLWQSLSTSVTISLTGKNVSQNYIVKVASDAKGANVVAIGVVTLNALNMH